MELYEVIMERIDSTQTEGTAIIMREGYEEWVNSVKVVGYSGICEATTLISRIQIYYTANIISQIASNMQIDPQYSLDSESITITYEDLTVFNGNKLVKLTTDQKEQIKGIIRNRLTVEY